MRVLLTTDTVGGVWTFTSELAIEFLRRQHAVALISFGREPSPSQAGWVHATRKGFPETFTCTFSDTPLEWMPDNTRAYVDGAAVLTNVIGAFCPDVLHFSQFCFGAFSPSIDRCLPKLITAHSDVLSWAAACRPEGLEDSAWLQNYRSLVQAGLAGADAIVAPTHWMADQLARYFPCGPAPQVLFNGRTLPKPPQASERKLQAVSAGRLWDEAKNAALLLQIESPVPIFLIGDPQLVAESREEQPNAQASGPVFCGVLAQDELFALFRQSSFYLAPSIYEPFGLAPLEAALCGCAVLANDLATFHEVWGDAALYFHDGPSLEGLLRDLLADPARLHAAQQRCFTRASELTAARMADAYLAAYQGLLTSPVKRLSASLGEVARHAQEPAAHAF